MGDYLKDVIDKYSKVVAITTTIISILWGVMHYFDQIQKNQANIAQINAQLDSQQDKIRTLELKMVELSTKVEINSQKCSNEK